MVFHYCSCSFFFQVRWRPVLWGIALQVFLAFIILRTKHGYAAFDFLGKQVTTFLDYTNAGTKFVFGDDYEEHTIAFKVNFIIIFQKLIAIFISLFASNIKIT